MNEYVSKAETILLPYLLVLGYVINNAIQDPLVLICKERIKTCSLNDYPRREVRDPIPISGMFSKVLDCMIPHGRNAGHIPPEWGDSRKGILKQH